MAVDLRWQRDAFQRAKVNATLGSAGIHKMNQHQQASCCLNADVQSLVLQCSARRFGRRLDIVRLDSFQKFENTKIQKSKQKNEFKKDITK